ncbi:MAG: sugar phosphate nucleotidyltransferase [Bacteroidales bacterium]|nr:sugar phosphate nucleotidyltransferase [Bacteroidales bacterium]
MSIAKNKSNYCLIMAGGLGSRFWPMSKLSHPKQFIDILGTGKTLIQQTYERYLRNFHKENIYIVTNEIYRDLVKKQLPDIKDTQILCEPARRNTAPCIAYATYKIAQTDPNANFVVSPSDHIIMKEDVFSELVDTAMKASASKNILITIGIKPSRPDTGYGYIQFVDDSKNKNEKVKKVKTFTEKPDLEMAKFFVQSGDFMWNAGIFIWSLKSITEAFEKHLPEVASVFKDGNDKYNTNDETRFIKNAFTICKSISLDYGIMEKADNVHVVCGDIGWSDLGTWGSLYDNSEKNKQGNVITGNNVLLYDSKNCIVKFPSEKLAVVHGMNDYIIVESDNTLLICKKTEEQQIRQFVNDVKIKKGEQFV